MRKKPTNNNNATSASSVAAGAVSKTAKAVGIWRSALEFRTEIVGHTTLCMLSLMGVCLYSFTYSFTYLATRSKSVAVLEMWAVYTHLFCSISTCGAQVLLSAMFGLVGGLPKIAEAQSSLFLGMAIGITCIGSVCLRDGSSIECAAFYPAAVSPPLAAAGSMAWAWVMYLASLGCQSAELSLSLGIGSLGGLITACTMACIEPMVILALVQKCRGIAPITNAAQNNNSNSASSINNTTTSTSTIVTKWATVLPSSTVDGIETSATLNALFLFAGALLGGMGAVLTDKINSDKRKGMNVIGVFFKTLGCICLSANAMISYSFPPMDEPSFRWIMALFAIVPIISPIFSKLGRRRPTQHRRREDDDDNDNNNDDNSGFAADGGDDQQQYDDDDDDDAGRGSNSKDDIESSLLPKRYGGASAARKTGSNFAAGGYYHPQQQQPYLRNINNFKAFQ